MAFFLPIYFIVELPSKPSTMPDNPNYPKKVLIGRRDRCIISTFCFQDPRWEMKYDDYNDLGFKVKFSPCKKSDLTFIFQAGGAALMPSVVLNPHAPAEVPAREWRH